MEAKEKQVILIDDDTNKIELSIEQLKETRTYADAHGLMPAQFPLEHHVFIERIMNLAEENNIPATVGSLTAPIKGIERISKTEAEAKGLDQNLAENTCVKNFIARIDFGDQYGKDLWNLAIGIMYNERGIEIAMGTNIKLCSNMTIWGEGKHYKNYGPGKVEVSEMFQHITDWFASLEDIEFINTRLLERMDAVKVNFHQTSLFFIGHCLKEAVRMNYFKGPAFTLNQGQVTKIAKYFISNESKYEPPVDEAQTSENTRQPSLYDIYNAGTFVLTHIDDPRDLFANIKAFTDWFVQYYLWPMELNPGNMGYFCEVDPIIKQREETIDVPAEVSNQPMTPEESHKDDKNNPGSDHDIDSRESPEQTDEES